MSFPGTFSFIGEITILLGIGLRNLILCLLSGFTMVFSAVYSLFLYSFVMLGASNDFFIKRYADISKREFLCLFLLSFFTLFFGVFPMYIIESLYTIVPFYLDFILSFIY